MKTRTGGRAVDRSITKYIYNIEINVQTKNVIRKIRLNIIKVRIKYIIITNAFSLYYI